MASAEEISQESGGVGGKFRKRSNRSDSKPYDRPRPPNWLSKRLVDPASRIITQGANKLFSLVFPKTLPTLAPTSEAKHESSDVIPDPNHCVQITSEDQEREVNEEGKLNSNSDGTIDDLEQLLKHKTFTRAEIDHLTELLRSRTSDVNAEDEKRRLETTPSQPVEAPGKMDNMPIDEDKVERKTSFGTASVSLSRSNFNDADVASPTELAKAYMESRCSKGTPPILHLHGQSGIPFTPSSHALAAVRSTDVPYASATRGPESGYLTPVRQGRSALYSMARTPYSRVHPTAMLKVNGSMTKENGGRLTSSQMSWKSNLLLSGGKQASKRRSSVLDSDIGSIGPIRRIRRKTNMMFPSRSTGSSSPLRMPSAPISSDDTTGLISTKNQFQLQGPNNNTSVRGITENGDCSSASRGSVCVFNQSRETAQKILQQLEKIAPSPKGKSRETTTVLETSPSRFIPGVLNGQGVKITEGANSSKLMQNTQVRGILEGSGDKSAISAHNLRSQKQATFDEGGPSTIVTSGDKLGPQAEATGTRSTTKDVVSSLRTATAVMSSLVSNVTDGKQDSVEKANKDSLEHEQRNHHNSLLAEKGKHDRPVVENKEIVSGPVTDEPTPGSFLLKDSNDIGSLGNHPSSGKNPLISDTNEVAITTPSSVFPALNRIPSSNKPKSVRFAFETVDMATPVASGSSGLNGVQSESKEAKLENTNGNREICRSDNDQKVGDGTLKHTVPSLKSAAAHTGIFSVGNSTNSSTSNGFSSFSPSNGLLSSPASTTTSASTIVSPTNSVSIHTSSTPLLQGVPKQIGSSALSQTTSLSDSLSSAGAKLFESGSGAVTCTNSVMSSTGTEATGFSFGSTSTDPTYRSAAAPVFAFSSIGMTSAPPVSFSLSGAEKPDPSSGATVTRKEQMDTESSVNEHSAPSFSQPPNPPPQQFQFPTPTSNGTSSIFQFSSQQDPTTSQNPLSSFSIGTGVGDKSNRRFIKVRRDKVRKR